MNQIRALGGYYTEGVENGAELRAGLNTIGSVELLRDLIHRFFMLKSVQNFTTGHAPSVGLDASSAARRLLGPRTGLP